MACPPREQEILQALVTGASNKLIAIKLGITEATVKVHLKTLLRKIDVNNRTQAAIWAMNNGFSAEGAVPTVAVIRVSANGVAQPQAIVAQFSNHLRKRSEHHQRAGQL